MFLRLDNLLLLCETRRNTKEIIFYRKKKLISFILPKNNFLHRLLLYDPTSNTLFTLFIFRVEKKTKFSDKFKIFKRQSQKKVPSKIIRKFEALSMSDRGVSSDDPEIESSKVNDISIKDSQNLKLPEIFVVISITIFKISIHMYYLLYIFFNYF